MQFRGRERHFKTLGLDFAARQWGNPDGLPVLALHGWLDNCASFDHLCPLLENLNLIAIDMAGHGLTSHRSADSSYNIWEDVIEIVAIADQLGWKKFNLLGHSRGAIISLLVAGAFPKRTQKVALLDGFFPRFTPAEKAPQQLADSIVQYMEKRGRPPRYYPSLEKAVAARTRGDYGVSREEAKLLAARGVRKDEQGYYWCSDRRLYLPSPVRLDRLQFMAFLQSIQSPIQLCVAIEGIVKLYPELLENLPAIPQIAVEKLPGGHHFHMGDTAAAVAAAVNRFFAAD